jgi:hypothetical protein
MDLDIYIWLLIDFRLPRGPTAFPYLVNGRLATGLAFGPGCLLLLLLCLPCLPCLLCLLCLLLLLLLLLLLCLLLLLLLCLLLPTACVL